MADLSREKDASGNEDAWWSSSTNVNAEAEDERVLVSSVLDKLNLDGRKEIVENHRDGERRTQVIREEDGDGFGREGGRCSGVFLVSGEI